MERIYFLRHGVAFDAGDWPGGNDALRPLTDEGIRAMEQQANYLRKQNLKPDAIATSPLVRAHTTAQIVAKAFSLKIQESDLLKPGFNVDALQTLVGQYAEAERIMVVGHEPDFSSVIQRLIGGGTVIMRKGSLARVDITSATPLRGNLVWLLTPSLMGA